MPNIAILCERSELRTFLTENLWCDSHQIKNFGEATMLWEHLSNAQPDLVLLDAESDGFGTMLLFQDLKRQFPHLPITVCQFKNHGDIVRIREMIDDVLDKNTT